MSKPFKGLVDTMSPQRRKKVRERTRELLVEMALAELRQSQLLTQQQLAATLGLNQAAVSKMERQSDMYVSTLRRILEAMGAKLTIIASFPDGDVQLSQFGDSRDRKATSAAPRPRKPKLPARR